MAKDGIVEKPHRAVIVGAMGVIAVTLVENFGCKGPMLGMR